MILETSVNVNEKYNSYLEKWTNLLREFKEGAIELIQFENEVLQDFPSDFTFLYRRICDCFFHAEILENQEKYDAALEWYQIACTHLKDALKLYPHKRTLNRLKEQILAKANQTPHKG